MEDGGPERRGGEPCPQAGAGDGAGPSGLLLLLLLQQRPARGAPAEPGGSSRGGLARSLQKAEAVLRSCVGPGLRRLLPPRPRERGDASGEEEDEEDEEDEEEEEAPALAAALEQSFPGLRRCLCVWEDPRTETFRGHVRPQPGDADAAAAAFSHHPVRPRVAERGAALHALLRHRHHLRLARDYSRRLKASSDFVRRLLASAPEPPARDPAPARPLRELCRELRTHAGHWSGLRRRMRGDPWLQPLLLRRHESVAQMRRALLLLALHAARLAERHAEARLRALARAGTDTGTAAPTPALLADLFQGLEIYNRAVGELELELGIAARPPAGVAGCHGAAAHHPGAFPAGRVLGVLAAERGRLAAERLRPLLRPRDGAGGAERVRWEDAAVPWPPERGTAAAAAEPSGREEPAGIAGELRALCGEDEELVGLVLAVLVASADSLRHPVLHGPKQEKPVLAAEPPEPPAAGPGEPSDPGWGSVRWPDASRAPAAEALRSRYRRLFWAAVAAALEHRLGLPHRGAGRTAAAVAQLSRALARAGVPRECEEELGRLCLRLLCRAALRGWDADFARALGSALSDTCSGEPAAAVPARSRTARCLQRLYPALAFALRCLRPLPGERDPGGPLRADPRPPGRPPCPRLQVLGCCLATAHAAGAWLRGRACRYLAAWALPQFLLVAQGDLQLLAMETERLVLLLSGAFPEPGDAAPQPPPAPASHRERQLCQQIRSVAASIQLFSGEVLRMFSADCKRLSAQIFDQTMPLGKHWRLGLRAELPGSPSAYAAAAAQAVLGQVLQGARLLPRDAQAPALARVTTAFLEAWMDHILARRIKFSLQGALQLRQDFELVRELVGSERYGLAPETRQRLLSLRVFRQMDGAILCLLQQPGGAAAAAPRPWHPLRRCCSDHGTRDPGAGNLRGVETPSAAAGPPPSLPGAETPAGANGAPESYFSGNQQQWLSLRLHRGRRWRVPGLACVGDGHEA